MNCTETRDLIQLHLDNELDTRATLEVQRHLEHCSACDSLLRTYARQDELLREAALKSSANTEALRKKILDGIARQQRPERQSGTLSFLLRAAAALIIVSVSTMALIRWGLPGFNSTVYAAVAADHADHCSPDLAHKGERNPIEIEKLVRRNSSLDRTPDLTSFGFGDVRALICRVNDVDYLHLVYQSSNNQSPLSLFFSRSAQKSSSTGEAKSEGDYTVLTLSASPEDSFFIVSSLDSETAMKISESLKSRR